MASATRKGPDKASAWQMAWCELCGAIGGPGQREWALRAVEGARRIVCQACGERLPAEAENPPARPAPRSRPRPPAVPEAVQPPLSAHPSTPAQRTAQPVPKVRAVPKQAARIASQGRELERGLRYCDECYERHGLDESEWVLYERDGVQEKICRGCGAVHERSPLD